MRTIKIIGIAAGLSLLTAPGFAQEEEDEGPMAYSYVTYFSCTGDMSVVDDMTGEDADLMNGYVEDGTIQGWGWLKHHTGGPWSRAFYYTTETIEGLFSAYDTMADDREEAEEDAADDDGPAFSDICWGHDDYIWAMENGSANDGSGAVGFSVYYECDVAREERAGEIVDDHVAPILDGYVEDGKLSSWGFHSHLVGGHIRALQTMRAPDLESLMAARAQSIEDIYAEDSAAGAEFAEICGKHADYIWNTELEY